MKPISASLKSHQRGRDRVPHVRAIVRGERWGVPVLPWERLYRGEEDDCPHALTVTGNGAVVRVRNNGGALGVSRAAKPGPQSAWGAWTSLGQAEEGTGVALAARRNEALLLSVASGGRELVLRRSTDGGATWSATRTLVRESAAIARVAVAVRASDGDACAFYTQGTNVLKRLRRRGGTWDAAAVAWNRGGGVLALTGIAAMHDGSDYRLVVTGRADPSGAKHAWAAFLGDTVLPENLWSGLAVIAESDASSGREFGGPAIFRAGGSGQRAAFAAREAGGRPAARVYTSHPPALSGGNPEYWSEPEPHEATSAHGLAVATADGANVWGATPDGVWRARRTGSSDVSERLIEASWRLAPFATRARVVLDDSDGGLAGVAPGRTVEVAPGYRSGPESAPEYGLPLTALVDRVIRESGDGRARVVLECSGHWERLAAWRAPQVWQSAAGERSREQIFWRVCAKAGIAVAGQGGADWSASRPAFAIAPGESGLSVARRLLGTTRVAVYPDGDLLTVTVPPDEIIERYGSAGHPTHSVGLGQGAPEANWVRARGPASDADAHDFASIYRDGQRLRLVRSLDAGSGTEALDDAAAALERERRERRAGLLVAPFHPGQELFDAIAVTDTALGLDGRHYRVVELGMEYSRRPGGRARYDSILGLGEMD